MTKKKVVKDIEKALEELTTGSTVFATTEEKETTKEVKEPVILPVSVDFTSEQLNNLARKVNEIVEYINK